MYKRQPNYLPSENKEVIFESRDKDNSRTVDINFLVVDIPMAYNAILRRLTLNAIKVVIAPYLLLMQFELDDRRVGKLHGDQKMAQTAIM